MKGHVVPPLLAMVLLASCGHGGGSSDAPASTSPAANSSQTGSSSGTTGSGSQPASAAALVAAMPVFSPAPGTLQGPVTVSISDSTPGVSIHYTTDGTTPTAASPAYQAPIPVTSTLSLAAVALEPGYVGSAMARGAYTIDPAVLPPAAPASLSAVAGKTTVNLLWPQTSGATSFHVLRATAAAGPFVDIGTTTASPYIDHGVTDGVTYYYAVAAVNAAGESAVSVVASATPFFSTTAIANGTYLLLNVNSALAVSDPGNATAGAGNAVVLQQAAPSGQPGQLWTVTALGSGLYSIVNANTGQPMDASNSGGANAPVDVYPANGGANQRWILTATGAGFYALSPSYNASLNIGVAGASSASGANLVLAAASAATSQQFQLVVPGSQATIVINQSHQGSAVTDQILGVNMAYWYDQSNAGIVPAFKTAGIKAIRWPGGSGSDVYHWETNSLCGGGYTFPAAQFPGSPNPANANGRFIADVVAPSGVDVAVTANYGTNAACTGPGDPAEAAAWVTAAKNNGNYVSHWTIGNEVYGTWETDLHTIPNDPATYAAAVANGYYPQMKAANPDTLVGVVVEPNMTTSTGAVWDPIVLSQAPYDFVEYHYYAQAPGQESDAYLVGQAAQALTTQLNYVKADLAAAGHPNTPIYVGELGSVYGDPGVQTSSITQALYAGQVLGELMNAGVSRATWWIGFGGCSAAGDSGNPNFSGSLYGFQNFGGYMVFSDGLPEGGCSTAPSIPAGTLLPTARALQLFSTVAVSGEHVLGTAVAASATTVRAYAATHAGGSAVVLFNTSQNAGMSTAVALSGQTTSANVTVQVYDKAIYDQSSNNTWTPPSTTVLGRQSLPLQLSLSPWSMTVVTITP